jgi:2-phospho-L-lactate guanylyltransferase
MSAAVVPVKHLAAGKSRLLPRLARDRLGALSLAMLRDILVALAATPSLERTVVVTPDADVADAAREAGALAHLRSEPGLNAAIDAAARELKLAEAESYLVVLGDVAGARAEDLEAMFQALSELGGRGVVLAPSRDGGSSALLRAPWDTIPSSFGPESGDRHRRAAERAEIGYRELPLSSLAIDLDDPRDVELFLAAEGGGHHTRKLLREIGW